MKTCHAMTSSIFAYEKETGNRKWKCYHNLKHILWSCENTSFN